tara:strand:+ start:31 stop:453 length:423 start_codon:yes stop_codon:yes gene_type:complete
MKIEINFKNRISDISTGNIILFVDEKLNITGLKKVLSNTEYSYINDLIKSEDQKKKVLTFDISSKKKILLISFKNNFNSSDAENLGAECYNVFSKLKKNYYTINTNTLSNKSIKHFGHFLHGIKLKSYKFEKYKTKKKKN